MSKRLQERYNRLRVLYVNQVGKTKALENKIKHLKQTENTKQTTTCG